MAVSFSVMKKMNYAPLIFSHHRLPMMFCKDFNH